MKKIWENWLLKNWIHLSAWTLFIIYETVIAGIAFNLWGHPVNYLLHYLINISFFYFNALKGLPFALKQPKKAFYLVPLVLIIEIICFIMLNFLFDSIMVSQGIIESTNGLTLEKKYILRVLYRCIYFLGFSMAYYFFISFLHSKKKAELIENERLNGLLEQEKIKRLLEHVQNSFLKAQINPHFLFNTLDYIYHHISPYSEEAADAIVSLSEMMRYAINADKEDVPIILGNEILQLEKLIGLYQLRQEKEINIALEINKEAHHIRFIPLVLMTLAENMFKHGNLMEPGSKAYLKVMYHDGLLLIETANPIKAFSSGTVNNKGLRNIEDRLRYIYKNNLALNYGKNEADYFMVSIKIKMDPLVAIR